MAPNTNGELLDWVDFDESDAGCCDVAVVAVAGAVAFAFAFAGFPKLKIGAGCDDGCELDPNPDEDPNWKLGFAAESELVPKLEVPNRNGFGFPESNVLVEF